MTQDGKTVLITGASGGVGEAAVRSFDDLGWQVFAGVRSLERGEKIAKAGSTVTPVELDLCDEASIARAARELALQLGPQGLDGLVNNAGLSIDGPLELLAVDDLRHQFEVNVIGQVAVIQAFLPMLRLARGRVVNIGGAAGRLTLPMYGGLSASKAALDSLTTALRMELKYQGVSVSYIEPGALQTKFFEKAASRRSRDEGNADAQRIYSKAIEVSSNALAKSSTSPVEAAVDAIVKAFTARRPAARYVVGRQAKLGLLFLPHLPATLRERLMMSSLGLRRETFDSATDQPAPTAR